MNILLPDGRISTQVPFSKIEALRTGEWDLEEVKPGSHSRHAKSVTSANSPTARLVKRKLPRTEPCFITKRLAITHERVHWVNAIRDDPETKRSVEEVLIALGIVTATFHLDSLVNLSNLDRMLHAALDKYAAIAVTGTLQSLNFLIDKVKAQNTIWQEQFNQHRKYIRQFDTLEDSFTGLEYELVLLLPEHLLPDNMDLPFYHRMGNTVQKKYYMVGPDRVLRETPGTADSPRLSPFTFDSRGVDAINLNPFLVILNAEIKFRRYIREGRHTSLAPDVQELMHKTCELVQEIYWQPVRDTTAPQGRLRALLLDEMDVDASSVSSVDPADMSEFGSLEGQPIGDSTARPIKHRRFALPADAEKRRDYIQYLLSGHDLPRNKEDYDLIEELNTGELPLSCIEEADVQDKVRAWVGDSAV